MNANKSTRKTNKTFDFSDSKQAIKDTAKTLNEQTKELADELFDDIISTGDHIKDMTLEPVIEAYDKISDKITLDNLSKTVKNVNKYSLKTAEELTEGVLVNAEKWQGVAEKAVKGGLKLSAKQQAIVFDALEKMKGQLSENASRFKKLFFAK
jgi:hypothetical protein